MAGFLAFGKPQQKQQAKQSLRSRKPAISDGLAKDARTGDLSSLSLWRQQSSHRELKGLCALHDSLGLAADDLRLAVGQPEADISCGGDFFFANSSRSRVRYS